jgi:hypothetical protein
MVNIVELIGKYGFPIVAACGSCYMVYFTWQWATEDIDPVLSEANKLTIGLIDRIRMLDNDLLRLNMKLKTVLMMREIQGREPDGTVKITKK